MKTVAEIIAYLQVELAEAYELHDQYKGKDPEKAFFYMMKATILTGIFEEITHE